MATIVSVVAPAKLVQAVKQLGRWLPHWKVSAAKKMNSSNQGNDFIWFGPAANTAEFLEFAQCLSLSGELHNSVSRNGNCTNPVDDEPWHRLPALPACEQEQKITGWKPMPRKPNMLPKTFVYFNTKKITKHEFTMNKQQLVYLLALSAMFLIDGRLASAQQTGITDQTSAHQSTKSGTQFLRLVKDSNGVPAALETAITRYRSDDGKLLVDLIGVIHIGESKYYRQLNRQFEQYDALLYELVAAEENQVPDLNARSSGSNPLHWLQSTMQNMLGLQSQLKYINYKKPNFVHADLSPRQMQQKMAARGDTAWSVAMQAMSEVMKQQSRASTGNAGGAAALGEDISSIEDLFSLIQNPQKLKTMLATQFASAGTLDAGLGSTLNELLITDRNQAAMKVLAQEIDKGQTQIGIFYGAAHMPDFEKRLVADFGMKKTKQVWAKAWDLKSAPKQSSPTAGLTDMFFQLMDSLEE